ncbi:MAG: GTPase ObgE [Eubacteriales bacterium]
MFIDRAKIHIKSGRGGNGSVSFRREPYAPDGGPDGGDGGEGGDVVFMADFNLRTLMDFRYKTKYEAAPGEDGRKKKQFGKDAEDLIIRVPMGTIIIDEETGLVMKDLTEKGERFVVARGGKGGKGNVHFKNSVRQAPNFAEAGGVAKSRSILLELKLIADVGLIGFPNVGKSTLLSVSTSAKPKIANYHFTTLTPNLGVVSMYDKNFVMADIPGLIEGAHEGAGIGLDFLKHIERTRVLIHVVDISGSEERDPIEDYEKINHELASYSEKLSRKPQIVAANKMDLLEENDEKYNTFKNYIENKGIKVFPIIAASNKGITELLNETLNLLEEHVEDEIELVEMFDFEKHDGDEDYRDVNVKKSGDTFILTGKQLEKIFNSTNFNDHDSLRYLYKYIQSKGGVEKMKELGLKEGDTVKIKDYEFEYTEG